MPMARDGGLGHVWEGVACPGAAWSAREIESQALATLAALAQISTPSAAHFIKSHQLLVQKFAADRDRQRSSFKPFRGSARPDLHTVCRSFHKISSALSTKVCGGSRSAKILIQSRGACEARSVGGLSGAPFIATIGGHLIEPQNGAARIHSGRLSWRHPTNATPGATDAFDRLHVEFSNTSSRPIWLLALTSCRGTGLPLCPCRVSITAPCSAMMAA